VIKPTVERAYELDLGKGTLAEIAGAVDDLKKCPLAEIDKRLVVAKAVESAIHQVIRKRRGKRQPRRWSPRDAALACSGCEHAGLPWSYAISSAVGLASWMQAPGSRRSLKPPELLHFFPASL
jgi:hypothetical protein